MPSNGEIAYGSNCIENCTGRYRKKCDPPALFETGNSQFQHSLICSDEKLAPVDRRHFSSRHVPD
jgi:hypothetical protein